MDIKARLSTFWIVVMINIAFADIFGFMLPGALEKMMAGSVGSCFPSQQYAPQTVSP